MAPLALAALGLLLGMRHATDPDHVIAVTAILSRERRLAVAARVGIVWGVGHTLTVIGVGAAIIVFKLVIPARLGLAMEFCVAAVLILLGLGAAVETTRALVRRAFPSYLSRGGFFSRLLQDSSVDCGAPIVHSHRHSHDGFTHDHPHVHAHIMGNPRGSHGEHRLPRSPVSAFAARRPLLRSFAVGLVHGLAGSAGIALLVLETIPEPLWATLYLLVFCLGTLVGMGLITTALAAPFVLPSFGAARVHQLFVTCSGLMSFGFGLVMAYQTAFVNGLFAASAIWIPH